MGADYFAERSFLIRAFLIEGFPKSLSLKSLFYKQNWVDWVCCCTHPNVMTKMAKKCSTDQMFIRKRKTKYFYNPYYSSKQFLEKSCLLNCISLSISDIQVVPRDH